MRFLIVKLLWLRFLKRFSEDTVFLFVVVGKLLYATGVFWIGSVCCVLWVGWFWFTFWLCVCWQAECFLFSDFGGFCVALCCDFLSIAPLFKGKKQANAKRKIFTGVINLGLEPFSQFTVTGFPQDQSGFFL